MDSSLLESPSDPVETMSLQRSESCCAQQSTPLRSSANQHGEFISFYESVAQYSIRKALLSTALAVLSKADNELSTAKRLRSSAQEHSMDYSITHLGLAEAADWTGPRPAYISCELSCLAGRG